MLCSKCAANLPEGSQFCLKCGESVNMPATKTAPPVAATTLACSKCGASLPEGSEFCLKCGKPVSSPAKSAAVADRPTAGDAPPAELLRPRRKRRIVPWVLLALCAGAIVWVASSESPIAQAMQEAVGWKHDQTILDTPFSVGPHTFRYYKFALPEGSVNVAVVGQFTTAGEAHGVKRSDSSKNQEKDSDNSIEAYVLSEAAFTIWQNGYAASSLYESGRVSEGTIHTDLPAGAGIYYLVFSNKFASKTGKNVQATVLLRYKSWLPEWFRRMKDRFWNWIGL